MSRRSSLIVDSIDQIDEEIPELSGRIVITSAHPEFIGNYSHVYRGEFNGETVAVKVLKVSGGLASMRRKVKRERITWALLEHPNIIPLLGYIENDSRFGSFGALVSPWCSNGDSGRWLEKEGHLAPLGRRILLWYDVACALEYLHTHNPVLVHGDIKPGNVLLDENGRAKLCDFGLVRVLAEGQSIGLTTTTEHTGTDRYIAPEFLISEETTVPTTASDVYALGCLGLKFVFMRDPYGHRLNNLYGRIFNDIKSGMPPSPKLGGLNDGMNSLWNIMESCWRLEPEDRSTAGQVADSLRAFSGWYPELATGFSMTSSLSTFQGSSKGIYLDQGKEGEQIHNAKMKIEHAFLPSVDGHTNRFNDPIVSSNETSPSCYPSAMDLLLSSIRLHKPYTPLTFTTKQISAVQAILQYLRDNPNPPLPSTLITSELAEVKDGHGWCLIGGCRSESTRHKTKTSYNFSDEKPTLKTIDQIYDHILRTHFNLHIHYR
ncbi:kinase-like protein [Serendipita vermifera]|nr:kinase-like protein [Serendipita vermifera]